MRKTCWIRLGSVVLLGLVLGCGGGRDDGEGDGISRGTFYTNVDIFTEGCGPDIHDVVGSDFTRLDGNRVRLSIYLDATNRCPSRTWQLFGTETGPETFDMDDVVDEFLCALDEAYGYGIFDVTNATMTLGKAYDRLEGDFTAEYDGGICNGDIIVTLTPR